MGARRRLHLGLGLAALAGLAAWQGAGALQSNETAAEDAAPGDDAARDAPAPAPASPAARPVPPSRADTPMAERVATLGLLNKRNGNWRDLTLKPGQAVRVGDVIVRLRACETTADWEQQKLTGAFVQTDVRGSDGKWKRVFSGWLFKESPSLNVVEHPVYDVWPKACRMAHAEIGPETVSAGAPGAAPKRSSAKKSAEGSETTAAAPGPSPAAPKPSAESSNAR